jgi:hypothetical protein
MQKSEAKTDSRVLLIWSIIVMAIGISILVISPFMAKWIGIEFEQLVLANKISLPSGWGICAVSLFMQFIDKLPDIAEAIRRVKK